MAADHPEAARPGEDPHRDRKKTIKAGNLPALTFVWVAPANFSYGNAMTRSTRLLLVASLLIPAAAGAQVKKPTPKAADPWAALLLPTKHTPTPTTAAITAADLRTRLFIFSDDSMMGRFAGSPGNVKGVEYIAGEAKRFGLLPAGQDGTFFQTVHVPLDNRTFDESSTISVDGKALVPWIDFLPRDPGVEPLPLDGVPVVYGGIWTTDAASTIGPVEAKGKFVVLTSTVTTPGNPPNIPSRQDVTARFRTAAGVAVVGLEGFPDTLRAQYHEPVANQHFDARAPIYMYVTAQAAGQLLGVPVANATRGQAGRTLAGNLRYATTPTELKFDHPVRNVVALLPGSDPVLRNEYVVIGAHNDHIGTVSNGFSDTQQAQAHDSTYIVDHLFRHGGADDPRPALDAAQQTQVNKILADVRKRSGGKSARIDSIFNGADDDGSGSVSVLELAEYFAAMKVKPKRSILFVWHVAEERGLWGSAWFAAHPTVPQGNIVAELNMDMVGRGAATDQAGNTKDGKPLHGGPGYLQAVGSRRLSTELGDLAESVNKSGKHGIKFDYSMDANGHPQNIYCRSDHEEYAKWGIPIAFFTTGGHADYHQLTDEPQYIDYNRMAQVGNFVADLATHVGNLDHRVLVDHPKPDPKAQCVQ